MTSTINASSTGSGGIVQTADASGVLALQANGTTAFTVNSDATTTFANAANLPNTFGFKNRIINGGMVIDQRNAGASVTPNSSYTLDRWYGVNTQTGKFTVQQNAGSVTPPVGFTNYLGITSTSAYSVGTGDTFLISQLIEGFNVSDFAFGTANAKTVTLSFQVYSSLTGTFGGALLNSAVNRSYAFSYSVPTANTWTTISVTIAGDTSGTWLTTNGVGLYVRFGLGSGSTYTQTAGSWGTGNAVQSTSTVSVVGTSGATFYITGVQLEKGSTATSFDFRSYGTELQLCQRYYQGTTLSSAICYDTAGLQWTGQIKVSMRATPTVTWSYSGTANTLRKTTSGVTTLASSTILYACSNVGGAYFYTGSGWSPALTVGQSYDFDNTFSAEL